LVSTLDAAIAELNRSGQLRVILERWKLWNQMTAAQTGDYTASAVPPTSYDAFVAATGATPRGSGGLDRYLGFLPKIVEGAGMTLEVSVLGMAIAVSLGLVLALCRSYAPAPLRTPVAGYIECVRGTPLLIQILFIFYALPDVGGSSPVLAG